MSGRELSVSIEVAPMKGDDLGEVMRIERSSFSSPWSRKMFEVEISGNPFSFSFVVRAAGSNQIIGYVCTWIVIDELHLLNLAVDPPFRRLGAGEGIIRWVLEFGRSRGARTGTLEVRVSNLPARRLYEKLGFEVYATRKKYYSDPSEDALLLQLNLHGGLNGPQRPGASPKGKP
jgi:ribosomal-protein-alanine N-acetyltransferase